MRDSRGAGDRVHGQPSPLDGAAKDALENREAPIDGRRTRAGGHYVGAVAVDRLPRYLAETPRAKERDDPLVEHVRVARLRRGSEHDLRIPVPPIGDEVD